jgi:hypothetical protein
MPSDKFTTCKVVNSDFLKEERSRFSQRNTYSDLDSEQDEESDDDSKEASNDDDNSTSSNKEDESSKNNKAKHELKAKPVSQANDEIGIEQSQRWIWNQKQRQR